MSTPSTMSGTTVFIWPNISPNTTTANAEPTISHFRCTLSANSIASNGPEGRAIAMMNEYSRLFVTVMPWPISSVGTQFAKP